MAAVLLMVLWVAGLLAWQTPDLPRWLQIAGLVVHVLVSLYFAQLFYYVWRAFQP